MLANDAHHGLVQERSWLFVARQLPINDSRYYQDWGLADSS
jgi:hypothetical protein